LHFIFDTPIIAGMNWIKLITELMDCKIRQATISREIGLSQPAIVDLLKSKTLTVKWEVGDKLIKMHKRVMRKKVT
jgi:hypothetical protein